MDNGTIYLTDYKGQRIRLPLERQEHILQRSEMMGQFERIRETIKQPEFVIATTADVNVLVYHRTITRHR